MAPVKACIQVIFSENQILESFLPLLAFFFLAFQTQALPLWVFSSFHPHISFFIPHVQQPLWVAFSDLTPTVTYIASSSPQSLNQFSFVAREEPFLLPPAAFFSPLHTFLVTTATVSLSADFPAPSFSTLTVSWFWTVHADPTAVATWRTSCCILLSFLPTLAWIYWTRLLR